MPPPSPDNPVADLVARCIIALEHEGPEAVDAILASEPERAALAREQLETLVDAGLLEMARAAQEQIGPYRILETLGQGGMGTVYLAEQKAPVRRRVALKVLRKDLSQPEILARFEQERNALALVAHPNICSVFDAGSTADGQPWIAMQYVRGLPITEYCTRRKLALNEVLGLFAQVCDAVQHAHQRGVLHRDLKPSNILVADRDNHPFPVVIDFGVAKSTRGNLGDQTFHTEIGRILGTPGYMSPEQARNEDDVDTRTDVYSLGIVLFELLAGKPPFAPEALRQANHEEFQQIMRDRARVRPSTAARHAASPPFAPRQLQHDLDWVVGKATDDDPNRRYAMPAALADDLRRFLRNDPIEARPPSTLYRMRKIVQRNRAATLATALIFVAMGTATITSLVFYNRAESSAADSDRHQAQATRAVDRMLAELASNDLARIPEIGPVRRRLLEDAEQLYREFLAEPVPTTDVGKLARAHTLVRYGRVKLLLSIGDTTAEESLAEARAIYAALPQVEGDGTFADRLLCAHWSARSASALLDSEQVENHYRSVLRLATPWQRLSNGQLPMVAEAALRIAVSRPDPDAPSDEHLFLTAVAIYDRLAEQETPRRRLDAAAAVADHTVWLLRSGRPSDAERCEAEFRARLAAADAEHGTEPRRMDEAFARATSLEGQILWMTEREIEAIDRFRDARKLHMELLASDPDPNARIQAITDIDQSMADSMAVFGRFAEAKQCLDQSIEWVRTRLALTPGSPRVAKVLARNLQIRASIEILEAEFGVPLDLPGCEALLDEASNIVDQLVAQHPRWTPARSTQIAILASRAVAYRLVDDPRRLDVSRQTVDAMLAATQGRRTSPNQLLLLSEAQTNYAQGLAAAGDREAARAVLESALASLAVVRSRTNNRSGPVISLATAAYTMARLCLDDDQVARARNALQQLLSTPPTARTRLEAAALWLECARRDAGRAEDLERAQQCLDEALEWYDDGLPEGGPSSSGLITLGRIHSLAAEVSAEAGDGVGAAEHARLATLAFAEAGELRPDRSADELLTALTRWIQWSGDRNAALDAAEAALRNQSRADIHVALAAHMIDQSDPGALAGAGYDPDQAFAALRRAVERDPSIAARLRTDSRFKQYREHPAFRALTGG